MKTKYLFGLPFVTININEQEIDALVDTGFNGEIMLPAITVAALKLQSVGVVEYILADGTIAQSDIHNANIMWLNKELKVKIVSCLTDLALVGMKLLHRAKTTLQPAQRILQIE